VGHNFSPVSLKSTDFQEGTFDDDDPENAPYKAPTILPTNAPTIDQNGGPDGIKIIMLP
jgi:hypothetical protein